jgi:hypothetical protein
MTAFSEILAFSTLTARASSLHVSSHSRTWSPSTTVANGATTVGPEDGEGGSGLHKACGDKLATHQGTFQPIARKGQNLTFQQRASSEDPPPSSFGGVTATSRYD